MASIITTTPLIATPTPTSTLPTAKQVAPLPVATVVTSLPSPAIMTISQPSPIPIPVPIPVPMPMPKQIMSSASLFALAANAPNVLAKPPVTTIPVTLEAKEKDKVVSTVPGVVVLNKQRLQEMVTEIDPCEQLDEDVEDYLLEMTDDFIERLVSDSCQVARHRSSPALEVKDVQLILEKYYNMPVPGFGPQLNVLNRLKSHSASTEAHKQRVALIKRTLKKF